MVAPPGTGTGPGPGSAGEESQDLASQLAHAGIDNMNKMSKKRQETPAGTDIDPCADPDQYFHDLEKESRLSLEKAKQRHREMREMRALDQEVPQMDAMAKKANRIKKRNKGNKGTNNQVPSPPLQAQAQSQLQFLEDKVKLLEQAVKAGANHKKKKTMAKNLRKEMEQVFNKGKDSKALSPTKMSPKPSGNTIRDKAKLLTQAVQGGDKTKEKKTNLNELLAEEIEKMKLEKDTALLPSSNDPLLSSILSKSTDYDSSEDNNMRDSMEFEDVRMGMNDPAYFLNDPFTSGLPKSLHMPYAVEHPYTMSKAVVDQVVELNHLKDPITGVLLVEAIRRLSADDIYMNSVQTGSTGSDGKIDHERVRKQVGRKALESVKAFRSGENACGDISEKECLLQATDSLNPTYNSLEATLIAEAILGIRADIPARNHVLKKAQGEDGVVDKNKFCHIMNCLVRTHVMHFKDCEAINATYNQVTNKQKNKKKKKAELQNNEKSGVSTEVELEWYKWLEENNGMDEKDRERRDYWQRLHESMERKKKWAQNNNAPCQHNVPAEKPKKKRQKETAVDSMGTRKENKVQMQERQIPEDDTSAALRRTIGLSNGAIPRTTPASVTVDDMEFIFEDPDEEEDEMMHNTEKFEQEIETIFGHTPYEEEDDIRSTAGAN